MEISFNAKKNEKNIRERGLSFTRASSFDFKSAHTVTIFRNGEFREVAAGYLEGRLHVLCYQETAGGIRVISFRKANEKEARRNGLALRR